MNALELISKDSMKSEMPSINVGDTVKIFIQRLNGDEYVSMSFDIVLGQLF